MRLLLYFFLLPALLSAQSALLKDPDIVWAAEIEQDWMVDIPSLDAEWEYGVTTLKLLRTGQNESNWQYPYLAGLVFVAARQHKLPVFQDAACKVPADPELLFQRTDTVVTFNPETYEEMVRIIHNDLNPYETFKGWRLKQILAYHRKSATWTTTVEAIAPVITVRDMNGDSVGTHPLFWFRPESKRQKLTSNSVVWAKSFRSRQAGTYVVIDKTKPVKITEGFQNPVPHLLKVMETDLKKPFYSTLDNKPLTPPERMSMLARTDTVVTFDPETYEEKVRVVRNDINADHIKELGLYQTWYWDERRNRLSICLDAVAPIRNVIDSMGNFRYSVPMFLMKTRK
ncbi:MAG: hypothetical protein IPJ82_08170 [Lewinellaceae bacterium]|nr:hypothetical protein [Lewinellaceae bacterium]